MSSKTLDVATPGAAIARQAAMEANLLREAEHMARTFLSDVRTRAKTGLIYPPEVSNLWSKGVDEMLSALPAQVAEYVAPEFRQSTIPDDVYTTALTILTTASQSFSSAEERNSALDRALSADGFAVEQISASLSPEPGRRDALVSQWGSSLGEAILKLESETMNSLVAAGFWDSLQETGSVWIKRIRRTTRTSATGLSGWITITAIRLQDYPKKRWVTRHDSRVRHTHRQADGQTVPVNQPFQVGGVSLMFPGERDAVYGEIVNCRCVLVGVK